MSDESKEIQAVIEKHLPKHVGETLQKRLVAANRFESENEELRKKIEVLNSLIRQKDELIASYRQFDERNSQLESREKIATAKEMELKVTELQLQLAAEKEKTGFAKDLALGLVRNTEYRKNVFHNEQVPFANNYGGVNYETKSRNEDTTETAQ